MKKKVFKVLIVLLYIAVIAFCIRNVVLATAPNISGFKQSTDADIIGKGELALGYVYYFCIAFSIGIITVAGAQYTIAAPEGKADIKKKTIYMVVGGMILFASTTIVRIVYSLTKNNLVN